MREVVSIQFSGGVAGRRWALRSLLRVSEACERPGLHTGYQGWRGVTVDKICSSSYHLNVYQGWMNEKPERSMAHIKRPNRPITQYVVIFGSLVEQNQCEKERHWSEIGLLDNIKNCYFFGSDNGIMFFLKGRALAEISIHEWNDLVCEISFQIL